MIIVMAKVAIAEIVWIIIAVLIRSNSDKGLRNSYHNNSGNDNGDNNRNSSHRNGITNNDNDRSGGRWELPVVDPPHHAARLENNENIENLRPAARKTWKTRERKQVIKTKAGHQENKTRVKNKQQIMKTQWAILGRPPGKFESHGHNKKRKEQFGDGHAAKLKNLKLWTIIKTLEILGLAIWETWKSSKQS